VARFERRLIDPDGDALGDAWRAAAEAAGGAAFGPDPQQWRHHWLDRMRERPEGHLSSEWRACEAVVAWWADPGGRRHVLIRAVAEVPARSLRQEASRPALSLVYPEQIFRRARPVGRWLAACACGAVGPPEALGWMGPCCGPCHDRREDHAPAPVEQFIRGRCPNGGGEAVVFTRDGRGIVVSDGRSLRFWGLHGGEGFVLFEGDSATSLQELTSGPEGRLASFDVGHRRLVIADSPSRPWATLSRDRGLVLSPLAFVKGDLLLGGGEGAALVERVPEGWRWGDGMSPTTAIAVSPDGVRVACGVGGAVAYYNATPWRHLGHGNMPDISEDIDFLAWLPDGATLLATTTPRHDDYDPPASVYLIRTDVGRVDRVGELPPTGALALSPCGRFLVGSVREGGYSRAEVVFWDVPSCAEFARLESDPRWTIMDLAFSPDGEALATISLDGHVQLWPWRRLLEA
jgi:WD40 repeat protein